MWYHAVIMTIMHVDDRYYLGEISLLCKGTVKLSRSMPWRHTLAAEFHLHSFLTSALDGGEGSLLLLGCFAPKEEPRARVSGPHLDIFEEEKNLLPLQGFKPQIVQPIVWSLYKIHYPGLPPYCIYINTCDSKISELLTGKSYTKQDGVVRLRFSQQCCWKSMSSGMYCCVTV